VQSTPQPHRPSLNPYDTNPKVVSDYLTPYDGEAAFLAARNNPVAVYTYKLAFKRHACSGDNCVAVAAS